MREIHMDLPHFTVCSSYFYILSMRRPLVFRVPDFWSKAMRDPSRSKVFCYVWLGSNLLEEHEYHTS